MKWFQHWKERRANQKLLRKLLLARTWIRENWYFVSGPWRADNIEGMLLFKGDLVDGVSPKWMIKIVKEIDELGKQQRFDYILISEIEGD